MIAVSWICRPQTPRRVDRWFRRLPLVSASLYSLGHVGNAAQKTMSMRITKLQPVGGFCAETGGAITLFLATGLGIPVSTTHTITGAIVGVGSVRNAAAVRWGVTGNIVLAWVLTIPCSAAIAAVACWVGSRVL
jgi:PiT family inorganic phosphate transporter